jgi:NADPH:quinone reductase-like Zn-dependent oxidoreductase
MRAVGIKSFGGRDEIVVMDAPMPGAGEGEAVVRVSAAGVGPWDVKVREGMFGEREFPLILGTEGSGVVESVGEGVSRVSEGDEVIFSASGAYAEHAKVSEDALAKKPENISFEDAAAIPVAGATAYQGIFEEIDLEEGETILIAGAAGGVGTFAVQIAALAGAYVIATASPRNHDYLKSLGAEAVVDYRSGDWVAAVKDIVPDGVDAAFDLVGGETFHRLFDATRDGGRVVTIVAFGEEPDAGRGISYHAYSAKSDHIKLAWLSERIETGELKVETSKVLPLEDAAEAHRLSEEGHTRGKIVLGVRS